MNENTQQSGQLIIGEGVEVKGNFTVPGRALINGQLSGNLTADELTVGDAGKVFGHIAARTVDVRGETNDVLQVREQLTVRGSGRVKGTIIYGELEIERGGVVSGELTPSDEAAAPADVVSLPVLTETANPASAPWLVAEEVRVDD